MKYHQHELRPLRSAPWLGRGEAISRALKSGGAPPKRLWLACWFRPWSFLSCLYMSLHVRALLSSNYHLVAQGLDYTLPFLAFRFPTPG